MVHKSTRCKAYFVPKYCLTQIFQTQKVIWCRSKNGAINSRFCATVILLKTFFCTNVCLALRSSGDQVEWRQRSIWRKVRHDASFHLMKASTYRWIRIVAAVNLAQMMICYISRLGAKVDLVRRSNKQMRLHDANSQLVHNAFRKKFLLASKFE